jgi:hypothetical protein
MNEKDQPIVEVGGLWPVKLKGPAAFFLAVIAVLLVAVAYLVDYSLSKWGSPFPIAATLQSHMDSQTAEHQHLRDAADESTYIQACALQPVAKRSQECEEVSRRLIMPSSLRKRLRGE